MTKLQSNFILPGCSVKDTGALLVYVWDDELTAVLRQGIVPRENTRRRWMRKSEAEDRALPQVDTGAGQVKGEVE